MRPPPTVVVGLRGSGRTHDLVTWLCGGRPVRGWPGWSRLLVVPDAQQAAWVAKSFPEINTRLHGLGTGGLGKLVVPADRLRLARGMDRGVEIAVDDVEALLSRILGGLPSPSVLAITGDAVTPGALSGRITVPDEQRTVNRPSLIDERKE